MCCPGLLYQTADRRGKSVTTFPKASGEFSASRVREKSDFIPDCAIADCITLGKRFILSDASHTCKIQGLTGSFLGPFKF